MPVRKGRLVVRQMGVTALLRQPLGQTDREEALEARKVGEEAEAIAADEVDVAAPATLVPTPPAGMMSIGMDTLEFNRHPACFAAVAAGKAAVRADGLEETAPGRWARPLAGSRPRTATRSTT